MKVAEFAKKTEELLAANPDKVLGAKLGKDTNVKMVALLINNNPTLVICTVNEQGEPDKILFCMEITDIDTAKLMQIWSQEITNVHSQNMLFNEDMDKL